jgi:DNA polymerase-3 subunit alpha
VTVPDFGRGELLAMEKELLGLYLSEHPAKPFEPEMRRKFRALRADSVKETQPNQEVAVGGLVSAVRTHYTKKGEPMLFVTLEDTSGSVSVTCFPQATREFAALLIKDAVVVVKGKASHRERIAGAGKNGNGGAGDAAAADDRSSAQQVEVLADKVVQIVPNAMAADARPRAVHIRIDGSTRTLLRMVKETLATRPGGSPLYLRVDTPQGEQRIKSPLLIDPDEGVLEQVRRMLGGGSRRVWVE